MELSTIIKELRPAISAMLRYWQTQGASLRAMKNTYRREWREKEQGIIQAAEIRIYEHGTIYRVHRIFYTDGHFQREETWLATYGWQSSGHLIALGREGYLIFDPLSKLLHVEEWTGNTVQLEIYHELNTGV
ncbi:hypothetical protein ACPPVU_12830 [Mucilaginibacter sp. McL0603]|uniref:hypothetical protein n=1 Tax=Mucilaginibacter sp. McL0603 TaxID=3415670 RepID=UPI003CF6F8D9